MTRVLRDALGTALSRLPQSEVRRIVSKYNKEVRIIGANMMKKSDLIKELTTKKNLDAKLLGKITEEAQKGLQAQGRDTTKLRQPRAKKEPAPAGGDVSGRVYDLTGTGVAAQAAAKAREKAKVKSGGSVSKAQVASDIAKFKAKQVQPQKASGSARRVKAKDTAAGKEKAAVGSFLGKLGTRTISARVKEGVNIKPKKAEPKKVEAPKTAPAPKKAAPKKAAPKAKAAPAPAASAVSPSNPYGLDREAMKKMDPAELFGQLPTLAKVKVLDPKTTGVKVGEGAGTIKGKGI
mgnify:CR=1 FL=1